MRIIPIVGAIVISLLALTAVINIASANYIPMASGDIVIEQASGGICDPYACIEYPFDFLESQFGSITSNFWVFGGWNCEDTSFIDNTETNCAFGSAGGSVPDWSDPAGVIGTYYGVDPTYLDDGTYYFLLGVASTDDFPYDCSTQDCIGFQYEVESGIITPVDAPPVPNLTGVSRIISFTPQNAFPSATTTINLTAQIESASPLLEEVCFIVSRTSDFQSFAPQTLCEPILSSGIVNVATTTTVADNSSFLYKVELYSATSSTPYQTSQTRYFSTGAIPWSSAVDFYNTGTTTELTPNEFCGQYEGAFEGIVNGICSIAMTILLVPGQAFTGAFTLAVGTLQSLPPMSWYYQIEDALTAVQYSDVLQQGVMISTGFGTEVEFLDPEQINQYTGGNLQFLKLMTTSLIWLMYVMYLINRMRTAIF